MTVIIGIARAGAVHMAADRLVNYGDQATHGVRKIRRVDLNGRPGLLAAAGNGALLGVLTVGLPPALAEADVAPPTGGPFTLGTSAPASGELADWADRVAQVATGVLAETTPPLTATDHESATSIDGALLLGYAGQLFYLFTHQAAHVSDGVGTLGAGSEVALGAATVALRGGASRVEAADVAVRLACDYIPGCGLGPGGLPPYVLDLEAPAG